MRKHRFFINTSLQQQQELYLSKELGHYIARVLRLRIKDKIFLFNNSEHEFTAEITFIERDKVKILITEATLINTSSPCEIHLGQVIGKGHKLDLVIQKATELGVTSITPLYSEHGVVKQVLDRSEHKLEHWQQIAINASAQCGRNIIPTIKPANNLTTWLKSVDSTSKIICSTKIDSKPLKEIQLQSPITALIGPEGGFSEQELLLAQQSGFQAISLGPRILRTETAGITIIAVLQAKYGDL